MQERYAPTPATTTVMRTLQLLASKKYRLPGTNRSPSAPVWRDAAGQPHAAGGEQVDPLIALGQRAELAEVQARLANELLLFFSMMCAWLPVRTASTLAKPRSGMQVSWPPVLFPLSLVRGATPFGMELR